MLTVCRLDREQGRVCYVQWLNGLMVDAVHQYVLI